MINNIYIKFLTLIINFIDKSNKRLIINFFKKEVNNNFIVILDIGAHKGETIDLFYDNFKINKILAFEANPLIYEELKENIRRKKNFNKIYLFNNGVGDKIEEKKLFVFNDSSSSTYNNIDKKTKYYQRKEKILSFLKFNKTVLQSEMKTKIFPLSYFQEVAKIEKIDILKIDTEGYELNVLKGIDTNHFEKIKYIYFEHHYDLMIKKNYTYTDIKNFLNQKGFYLSLKLKMKFRKTFEYVYENKKL
jgi:FkbM family methyltransferase